MSKSNVSPKSFDLSEFRRRAEEAAREERAIQCEIDKKEQRGRAPKKSGAMQAGARVYPEPPLPGQHLLKPGEEAELRPRPMFDAPHYKGSEKLKDKVALVTGGIPALGGRLRSCSRVREPTSRSRTSSRIRMPKRRSRPSRKKAVAAFSSPAM